MQWSPPRSLAVAVALASMTMGGLPWRASPVAHGQVAPSPAASEADAELAKRVEKLDGTINPRVDAGQIADAVPPAMEKLDLLARIRGKDHWQTADARRDLETYRRIAGLPREAQDRFAKAHRAEARAIEVLALGQYAEAALLFQENLSIHRDLMGEDHPITATSYNNVAATLYEQGKYAEAEAMYRRAQASWIKALGEGHPDVGTSYSNLAALLEDRGKYAEAEVMNRRALAVWIKALGADHPNIGSSYNNLADSLGAQGKYAESEAMHRHALAVWLKALGADHPHIAYSYSNLAVILREEGKLAEAEAMNRRALATSLKALGESNPDTARSYNNLANILGVQGKSAEAEALNRRALAVRLKALGPDHPDTASSYSSLASNLGAQSKYAEAEAMDRHALAVRLKALGPDHPYTARGYNSLALILGAQSKYAESEAMHGRALAIRLKALGEGHPDTATTYDDLARSLDRQGKHDDALRTWTSAAASYERGRLRGTRGLEAALTASHSPLPSLAMALARAGRPREAWTRWEQGLARGLVDEVTGRAARPLTPAEREREAGLLGQAQAIDERIGKLLAVKALSQEQDKLLEDLRREGSELRRQLLELEQEFESKYQALAGRPASLEAAQEALPGGTALVGWVDRDPEHWACLLRRSGDPVWVRLTGSGKEGTWTKQEVGLAQRLRADLTSEMTKGDARPLAEALARQRLEPLKGHLKGANRLIVANSPGLAGVPVEVLLVARPDPAWAGITVGYAPSASMFAHLVSHPVSRDRPDTLLALADPAYPETRKDTPSPTPPDAGLAIAQVVPNGNADLNGIQTGDVLLTYAGTALKQHGDLKPVAADAGPKKVSVTYWREGITRQVEVAAGPLGVAIDDRPAGVVVPARQAADRVLLGMRGGSHARLPGTRREVEAVARLFPAGTVTTIMGEQARESVVQDLARSGKLKGFRYLHFASHGESDPRNAYRSALILAPDPDRPADSLAFDTDGTITAEQIARTWELDADLVVLSACETGLGLAAGGEGYLGFAQPLFAKGARSLLLSQWKVDDDATALLMTRFYANLLGTRPGLKSPMPKAEALAEAKAWLREAKAEEVGRALAALPRGSIVHREVVVSGTAARPYEDPRYWAGFILIGSPD